MPYLKEIIDKEIISLTTSGTKKPVPDVTKLFFINQYTDKAGMEEMGNVTNEEKESALELIVKGL